MKEQIITISKKRRIAEAIITPEVAQELLNRQSDLQRKLNPIHLNRLVNVMIEGKWIDFNGDTIKFDVNGLLLDGQHRLYAVIKSRKAIRTYIALGLDKDDIYFMDLWHKSRKTSDVFAMKGITNYAAVSSAISSLWKYDNKVLDKGNIYPDPEETFKYYLQNTNIQESFKYAFKVKQIIGLSLGVFLHYLFCRFDKEIANSFFESMADGADLKYNNPILILRNRLLYLKRKEVQLTLDVPNRIALVILAWNAIRENRKLTQLRWSGNEFPEAI